MSPDLDMRRFFARFVVLAALSTAGGSFLLPAALAQLDSDSINFTGTVPGTCSIAHVDDVTMSLSGTTFTGTTANIAITANTGVKVSLSAITDNNNTDNNSAAVADIDDVTDSQDSILSTDASESSGSSSTNLGNTADQAHNVRIDMTVTNADTPGSYSYTITINCLTL